MKAEYPKYIPLPGSTREVVVKSPADHERVNPEDYAAMVSERDADPTGGKAQFVAAASAADERERCAIIAETFPQGGKVGARIAATIRGIVDEEARFPKVLRNRESSPVSHGDFTVPGPNGTFIQPDVTVNDAAEEAAARAKGFTVIVSQNTPSGVSIVEPMPPNPYPKTLRDPSSKPVADAKYTEKLASGQFGRKDVVVKTSLEEAAARSDGFTVDVPPLPPAI